MDTIIDALKEGRLFELPESDKPSTLQFLSHIIEAFPETPAGMDILGLVMKREEAANTALGKGWACPHARVPYEEDLMCVIGWSPEGIDYGAPDGEKVYIAVMHVVPDNQKSHYLKEISLLAKALVTYPKVEDIQKAKNLDDVRLYLIDLIESTKEAAVPDARAKMITLQAKAAVPQYILPELTNLVVEPLTIVACADLGRHVVLMQNPSLSNGLESSKDLLERLNSEGVYQWREWRILKRGVSIYQEGREVYDCLAIKIVDGKEVK